jgi:hypothetical protein
MEGTSYEKIGPHIVMDHYMAHPLTTFRTYSSDESNFFKERRNIGIKERSSWQTFLLQGFGQIMSDSLQESFIGHIGDHL